MRNTELWQKICEFKLDDTDAEQKFSDKLCKEEKWSEPFAALAISEYKKFIYLCAVLPGGASPSPVVDKVWHLHLTYTDNYWNQFCKKVIGKDIHHFPSKGGKNETIRHQDWYDNTKRYYVEEFGEMPPANIWGTPKTEAYQQYLPGQSPFRKPEYPAIGSLFEYPQITKILLACGGALLILLIIMGNPYQLSGQSFLLFYALLMLIGFVVGFAQKSYTSFLAHKLSAQLHPIHFSLVFKNIETTMQMIVVNLIEKQYLRYEATQFYHVFDKGEPLFYGIQAYENELIETQKIRKILFSQVEYFKLLVGPVKEKIKWNISPFFFFHAIIIIINIIRIVQGLWQGKPVLFLGLFLIAYPVLIYFISRFTISNKSILQQQMQTKSTDYNFTRGASDFMFTNFYLLNGSNGLGVALNPLGNEKKWQDTSSSSCGSSCSSDGGGGGDGCGGCGGD